VTSDLLRDFAITNLFDKASTKKYRFVIFDAALIISEPVFVAPRMRGPYNLRMRHAILRLATIKKEMAKHSPSSRYIELDEKLKQSVYDFRAFEFAGGAKPLRAEQIERSPDQFEVYADGEDAAIKVQKYSTSRL